MVRCGCGFVLWKAIRKEDLCITKTCFELVRGEGELDTNDWVIDVWEELMGHCYPCLAKHLRIRRWGAQSLS